MQTFWSEKFWLTTCDWLQVKTGNTVVEDNSLVVGGYDVSGEVTSDGEAIRGVSFLLFQKEKSVREGTRASV